MKKVSLVVRDRTQVEALTTLRGLGVLHLEKRDASSDALSKALEQKASAENALGILQLLEQPKKGAAKNRNQADQTRRSSDAGNEETEPYSADAVNAPARPDLVDLILNLGKDQKACEDQKIVLDREQQRLEKWGDFKPGLIQELAEQGIKLHLYELSPNALANIPEEIRYIISGQDKATVRLVVLDQEIPGLQSFRLPEKSLSELGQEQAELSAKLQGIKERLNKLADRKSSLIHEIAQLQEQVDLEFARASLEQIDEVPPEYAVSWISGYAPQEDVGAIKRAAAEHGWAMIADDPGPDDDVPTKLKNNKLVSLIYPLTDFLEVVPGYQETDISGWFLFFFTIFFGMIFGDAVYGLLFIIIALIGIAKTAKKGVPAIFKLVLLLGFSNFVWGILTCTWGGMDADKLPLFLQNISLPLISNVTAGKSEYYSGIVQQNLMIFCFSLAVLQLSIGHIIKIFKSRTLKLLGDLGSAAMLGGMYFIVLSLIASNASRQIPFYMSAVYAFAAGFVLNFLFANYDGSIGRSIMESLKNMVSVILNIANVFSDIMSYIRLWAVGLAGGAIALTVNSMAGPMLGHMVFFIFGIALLIFGHGLNMVLNVLSVLVHGVRLNTLEFSGHVGLTWSGHAYRPFAKRVKDEAQSA
ncbi:V-type ATP synthase subunit I [Treponema primitia]|nr:V-type ATP synthase subunit I [Treponema primitia]